MWIRSVVVGLVRFAAISCCVACRFVPGAFPPDDGAADDGATIDAPECDAWNAQHFEPCQLASPSACLDLELAGSYVYDSDTRTLTDPSGAVIAHTSTDMTDSVLVSVDCLRVGVSSTLRAIGTRPLIVASWSTIEITGLVDVSSSTSGAGAGANASACALAQVGENDPGGAGGGGGGAFQGAGGKGGDGDSNQNAGNDGIALGGLGASAASLPVSVRGGCPGANGGEGTPGVHGDGGAGGGAIQLTARIGIRVDGTIHAGGQGGIGKVTDAGGGGGGSGGYIGLDAPTIDLRDGVLAANGGAGSGGGDDSNLGVAGEDGRVVAIAALGGIGGLPGGTDGGDGGYGGTLDGELVTAFNTGAGGGGGGGAGYILLWGSELDTTGAVVTPAEVRL